MAKKETTKPEILKMRALTSDEQTKVNEWKAIHGEVIVIGNTEKLCFFRKPRKEDLLYAASEGAESNLAFNGALMDSTWLGGDHSIIDEPETFVTACAIMNAACKSAELSLLKL